jgi:hypothetical protein
VGDTRDLLRKTLMSGNMCEFAFGMFLSFRIVCLSYAHMQSSHVQYSKNAKFREAKVRQGQHLWNVLDVLKAGDEDRNKTKGMCFRVHT